MIRSYLIRVKILTDEIDLDDIDESSLAEYDLEKWLLFNDYHVLLAELYFKYARVGDALDKWKEYIEKSNFDRENIKILEDRLLSMYVLLF